MTIHHDKYEQDIEWLLDLPADEAGAAAARERLNADPALRAAFEPFARVAEMLGELGETLNRGAGTISIREAVQDAIAHRALEGLSVANANPYQDIERAFGELKEDFDARAGRVDLVSAVMAAVAAGRQTEAEVEQQHPELTRRLVELGEALHARTPAVELVAPVMEALEREPAPSMPNVVPMRARPSVARAVEVSAERPKWPAYLGLAATIAVCFGAGWMYLAPGVDRPNDTFQITRHTPENVETPLVVANGDDTIARSGSTGPEVTDVPLDPDAGPESGGGRGSVSPSPEPLTLREAINARRRDLVQDSRQIAALASLTEEEAAALLRDMDLSLEALIGATQFLSPEEAIAVLRAAIVEHPDDPNLLYALARNLDANPEYAGERMNQLGQLASADPDNSLPHYMMASEYFARGDMALGLDALSAGSSYGESSAYALEGAQQREAALLASGLPQDVARYLALTTSGEQEYADISTLRDELMGYGAYYEELGEYDTAQQIYNAMNQLGVQLSESADLAVEQQYGYETQERAQVALLTIQGIAEIFQQPETVALLGRNLGMLATGIAEVTEHIVARQEMIEAAGLNDPADAAALLDYLMRNGDLDLAGYSRR